MAGGSIDPCEVPDARGLPSALLLEFLGVLHSRRSNAGRDSQGRCRELEEGTIQFCCSLALHFSESGKPIGKHPSRSSFSVTENRLPGIRDLSQLRLVPIVGLALPPQPWLPRQRARVLAPELRRASLSNLELRQLRPGIRAQGKEPPTIRQP